jgi:hypothetical protein
MVAALTMASEGTPAMVEILKISETAAIERRQQWQRFQKLQICHQYKDANNGRDPSNRKDAIDAKS